MKTPATLHKGKEWDDSVSVGALPNNNNERTAASRGRNGDGKTNSVRNDPQGRFQLRKNDMRPEHQSVSNMPSRGDSPNAAYSGKNPNSKLNAYKKNLHLYSKVGQRGKSPGKKTTKKSALSGNGDEQLNISESNRRIEKYDNMIGAVLGRKRNKDYDVPKKLSLGYRPVIPSPGRRVGGQRNINKTNNNLDLLEERNEEHLSAVSVPPLKIPQGDPYYEE